MWPAAESTARPSGSRHPVTRVFESEPSGLTEKMRPPLRSSTNRRPLEERESVMFPPHGSLRARQGVRDQRVARRRHHEVMAAGHDNQILLTLLLIDDRRGLAAGREHVTPQDLSGLDVDRLDQVVGGRRDKDQAARGYDRSAIVRGADLERNEGGHAERTVPPSRAERPIPQRLPGGEIDRADASIWGSGTQHASR